MRGERRARRAPKALWRKRFGRRAGRGVDRAPQPAARPRPVTTPRCTPSPATTCRACCSSTVGCPCRKWLCGVDLVGRLHVAAREPAAQRLPLRVSRVVPSASCLPRRAFRFVSPASCLPLRVSRVVPSASCLPRRAFRFVSPASCLPHRVSRVVPPASRLPRRASRFASPASRLAPRASRTELVRCTGSSNVTIANLSDRLLRRGILPRATLSGRGRPPRVPCGDVMPSLAAQRPSPRLATPGLRHLTAGAAPRRLDHCWTACRTPVPTATPCRGPHRGCAN